MSVKNDETEEGEVNDGSDPEELLSGSKLPNVLNQNEVVSPPNQLLLTVDNFDGLSNLEKEQLQIQLEHMSGSNTLPTFSNQEPCVLTGGFLNLASSNTSKLANVTTVSNIFHLPNSDLLNDLKTQKTYTLSSDSSNFYSPQIPQFANNSSTPPNTAYSKYEWMKNSKMQADVDHQKLAPHVFSAIYLAAERDMLKFMSTIAASDPSPNTPEHTALSQSYFDHYLKQHLKAYLCSQVSMATATSNGVSQLLGKNENKKDNVFNSSEAAQVHSSVSDHLNFESTQFQPKLVTIDRKLFEGSLPGSKYVWMSNLPNGTCALDIKKRCESYGKIRTIKILGRQKRTEFSSLNAYLIMDSTESANCLVRALEHFELDNNVIYLKQNHAQVKIDLFEKLPAPFGLIRYGVAPDHPEVKAYGAAVDQHLNIPGELFFDLDCETVAIIGMGNVAVDTARLLLCSTDRLKFTDMPEPVIASLNKSRVRKVILIGRRGPLQAAFTLKEVRELTRLESTLGSPIQTNLIPSDIFFQTIAQTDEQIEQFIQSLPRPRRRLTEFLYRFSNNRVSNSNTKSHRICELRFLRSPIEIIPKSNFDLLPPGKSAVDRLKLVSMTLEGPPSINQKATPNVNQLAEYIDCGLIVRSIGYRGVCIDPDLPFNHTQGVIKCDDVTYGRISKLPPNLYDFPVSPMYCTGWIKRGPVGVIVDTAVDARQTAKAVVEDLGKIEDNLAVKPGSQLIKQILQDKNLRPVTFDDWERVNRTEILAGQRLGKPREKLTSVESMLNAAFAEVVEHRSKNST